MRIVIVDDQEIERFHMAVLFKHCPGVEVVGEADNIETAADLINRVQPDAVFLDIDLGDERRNGFDLLPLIETRAKIIFVTLYNEFAVRAFRVNAMDYLIKPVTIERLTETLVRLNDVLPAEEVTSGDVSLESKDMVLVKGQGKQALLPVDQICAITADGDYTRIYSLYSGVYYMRRSMKRWLELLPEELVTVLDRKLIVGKQYIHELRIEDAQNGFLTLHGLEHEFKLGRKAIRETRKIMKEQ